MEPLSSKTVGGWHVMTFAISVHVCLIMNLESYSTSYIRAARVMNIPISDRVGFAHGP